MLKGKEDRDGKVYNPQSRIPTRETMKRSSVGKTFLLRPNSFEFESYKRSGETIDPLKKTSQQVNKCNITYQIAKLKNVEHLKISTSFTPL